MSSSTDKFDLPAETICIGEALRDAGGRPVLVGGWVRDHLLGDHHSKDFDLEVFNLEPDRLQKLLAKFGPVHAVGRQFGVLRLATREAEYDVSVPRRESKTGKGHKGFWVEADPAMSFEQAAARRDFTINAMGYAYLEEKLLDPHGGRRDLKAGLLRHVGPAFGEDPLRVMRAMQFAGRFSLTIAPETLSICRAQDLSELPRERMWEEFKKLLLRSPAPSRGLAHAAPLGILPHFPELQQLALAKGEAPGGAWQTTMDATDYMARLLGENQSGGLVLMLAALCHGMRRRTPEGTAGAENTAGTDPPAERPARAFLERLTNETRVIDSVLALVREQAQPGQLYADREAGQDSAVRRLALRVEIPELELLGRARHLAREEEEAAYPAGDWLLERAEALNVLRGPPEPLLKGRHLREQGFPPGRTMGMLLKQAFELQLDGRLNSEPEARRWARQAQSDTTPESASAESR